MNIENCQHAYFIGIGGIGMSAIAKYFFHSNINILGYDSTKSDICAELENMGIDIVYDSTTPQYQTDRINFETLSPQNTIVIYTPAVSENTPIFQYFRNNHFHIYKRSEILGEITKNKKALCVAGTHGKTTISSMLAHLFFQSRMGINAFLGGITNNYNTNVLIDKNSEYVVVEADEFDHSFYHLNPFMSIISAVDADHLDIYQNLQNYQNSFIHYAQLIQKGLILNTKAIERGFVLNKLANKFPIYTYGLQNKSQHPDFYASNIKMEKGNLFYDFNTPSGSIPNIRLGVPIWINIENSVAALSMAYLNGLNEEELRNGIKSFKGVQRRFDIHVNTPSIVYIDDYAHHPEEIKMSIQSVKKLFPLYKLIVIFQPHLFSRTRDFASSFAQVLSLPDLTILLPIYPARETPIPNITSRTISEKITTQTTIVAYENILPFIKNNILLKHDNFALMTIGAGNIGNLTHPIKKIILDFIHSKSPSLEYTPNTY